MFSFLKNKNKETNNIFTNTVNREDLLNSDKRYKSKEGYCSDFESCTHYYNFLKENFSESFHLLFDNVERYNSVLSGRNICCLICLTQNVYDKDEKMYWHELSDFIHNYNSEIPVSFSEAEIFVKFYEYGLRLWAKS